MAQEPPADIEDNIPRRSYNPITNPFNVKPAIITHDRADREFVYFSKPFLGSLVLENVVSETRDHCANERTFLSWLRLSMYLCIVACAIILSFHLRSKPSSLERRMALPLGIVFWVLSLFCLVSGFATYVRTLTKYSRRKALVQSGWKTQMVFVIVAIAIIGTCILLLVTNRTT
ncbi:hypothetical protein VTO42DRAFT_8535 [Malbranchea cinnamomea]